MASTRVEKIFVDAVFYRTDYGIFAQKNIHSLPEN
jgi:hypothetical protein